MSETIAAISTAMTSSSGIGIVRMSGDRAVETASEIFSSASGKELALQPSHTIHYGHIVNGEEIVDEVLLMLMRAPHTYTREDVVEINCHGGILVLRTVLELLVKHGARPAEPGEFTKRAFLNGRIDLSQAEAVMDLIQSKSRAAMGLSLSQLGGRLSEKIRALREEIILDVANIEASLDDPEHIDGEEVVSSIKPHCEGWIEKLEKLKSSAAEGIVLREGIKTVILGKPNAGKSSVMNVLAGQEYSIVTDIEGTTRDILREQISFHGLPLIVADTAGIRRSADRIEQIGMERARAACTEADLVLYVVDSQKVLDENDVEIINMLPEKKVIVLLNKSDLGLKTKKEDVLKVIDAPVTEVSAKEERGFDALGEMIKDMFFSGEIAYNDEVFISSARHLADIEDALGSIRLAVNSIESGMPEDFISGDLMDAYGALGSIIGESLSEDLIETIFSKFCMGK